MKRTLYGRAMLLCVVIVALCGFYLQFAKPQQAELQPPPKPTQVKSPVSFTLAMEGDLARATAERRKAGKPDPVTILLDVPKERLVASPIHFPPLKISLKNVDIEKATFQIHPTSDYRSGRLPKFRIVLKDVQGKELPPRPRFSGEGGGILRSYKLAPGESWDTTLNLRGYLNPLPPGEYRLRVLYSDDELILEKEDLSKVVCCQSTTIDLFVLKLPIRVSEVDAAVVRENIAALDGDQPLRIVAGTYGEWAHGFIAKESPAGQLLALGRTAIPQLVEAAQDKALSSAKRAWLLGILFSITGQNDPRGDNDWHAGGCVESCEWVSGPWSLEAGKDDEQQPLTIALPSTGSTMSSRTLNPQKIEAHAAKWRAWLQENCEVERESK